MIYIKDGINGTIKDMVILSYQGECELKRLNDGFSFSSYNMQDVLKKAYEIAERTTARQDTV